MTMEPQVIQRLRDGLRRWDLTSVTTRSELAHNAVDRIRSSGLVSDEPDPTGNLLRFTALESFFKSSIPVSLYYDSNKLVMATWNTDSEAVFCVHPTWVDENWDPNG